MCGLWLISGFMLKRLSGKHEEDYGSIKDNREGVDIIITTHKSCLFIHLSPSVIHHCFHSRVRQIPELFVVGRPDMTLVAFGSDTLDIFEVNDIMSSKGWHLNALQRPNRYCSTISKPFITTRF